MFDTPFISDPNFQYTQYFTFENFLLAFCVIVTIFVIFLIIPDLFTDEDL